jgi:hypothetical protein
MTSVLLYSTLAVGLLAVGFLYLGSPQPESQNNNEEGSMEKKVKAKSKGKGKNKKNKKKQSSSNVVIVEEIKEAKTREVKEDIPAPVKEVRVVEAEKEDDFEPVKRMKAPALKIVSSAPKASKPKSSNKQALDSLTPVQLKNQRKKEKGMNYNITIREAC